MEVGEKCNKEMIKMDKVFVRCLKPAEIFENLAFAYTNMEESIQEIEVDFFYKRQLDRGVSQKTIDNYCDLRVFHGKRGCSYKDWKPLSNDEIQQRQKMVKTVCVFAWDAVELDYDMMVGPTNRNSEEWSDSFFDLYSAWENYYNVLKQYISSTGTGWCCAKRKNNDSCPICLENFQEKRTWAEVVKPKSLEGNKDIVYCRVGCGQNIHKECLDQWFKNNKKECVLCRQYWK